MRVKCYATNKMVAILFRTHYRISGITLSGEIITKINACYQSKNSSYIIKERIFCLNIFFVIQLVHLYCVVVRTIEYPE
jgi:hypothetical protein